MNLLIKNAQVIDPGSPFNGKKTDILIENGVVQSIGKVVKSKNVETFEADNLHISPGWFDMHANFMDPGFEYKEDLISGIAAAANGGFTGTVAMPSTHPPVDSKSGIEYIINKTKKAIVDVYPIGTVSEDQKGQEISEMYDMHLAGAIAFSDDKCPVPNADLMKRALLYTRGFDGLLMHFPDDRDISGEGMVNEGKTSTMLGLKGMPSLAEEIIAARDIYLADYCDSKIHFSPVSARGTVDLIRSAKKKGVRVTAAVAAHQLVLNDDELHDFNSNYKVLPPLREKEDIASLISGLKDGTIDVICSDHTPQNEESKKREFDHADFGISGIETAYAILCTFLNGKIKQEALIEKIAINPRKILKLEVPVIKEGANANFTLFDPALEWKPSAAGFQSKSKNNPFIGKSLKGKPLAVFNKGLFKILER